ncbi:hypothetical protein [Flavobacterium subsaxonicum]|uniref:Uncharacterized protein n=1 Tax=Flavobacterium subsaxonicum WB 4.1-42 = DSM 21790 TaxID=1121898 RepID=A0A0A2N2M2_9FLAO|nr:hypothetical protein [Flavobacterium subsaxonicum]KGO94680.1 hypothetical protein Q766_00750 [Flavobacterium subsaxonicum WB 4.1-42 = DSM 21790]
MSLQELYKGAKIIETIENYALAEDSSFQIQETDSSKLYWFYTDEEFWKNVIAEPTKYWGQKINLYKFVVSNWIARVPGLYWSSTSEVVRQHEQEDIAIQSEHWLEFYPPGKSKKVMGGVGTLLLPPTEDGKTLMSISAGCNASVGIPILCFPEVIDQLKIKQGDCVVIREAKWQPMDTSWASKFASTQGIPRGYLLIDSIDKIEVFEKDCPIVYHPFSLMEYEYQDSLFYDFVYVTADSKVADVDSKIQSFFKNYAKKDGRYGEYLLNPNIVNPIFDSRYSSPLELTHASEKAKLNLLYERIRGVHFKGISIEQLIIKLPQFYQSSISVKTLAKNIGFNVSLFVEDSAVSMSSQLINKCIEKEMIESLIDRVAMEYPQIFN